MGCCGDEDDDFPPGSESESGSGSEPARASLSTPLLPSPTISPANSLLPSLLSHDLLRAILVRLPSPDLARAACVCRGWSAVAAEREVVEEVFARPWRVRRVVGEPSSRGFWRGTGSGRFAISHRIGRGESVASLALKYHVQVMDIKRLNNMMSDHGIYSRERLLIPISKPELLHDQTCYIEMDMYAKREVAVLYLEGHPDVGMASRSRSLTNEGKKKILNSIKRSLGVDDATAQYYMSISSDDPRAAIMEFSEDLRWEQQSSSLNY